MDSRAAHDCSLRRVTNLFLTVRHNMSKKKTFRVHYKDGLKVEFTVTAPSSFLKGIHHNKDVVYVEEVLKKNA